MLYKYGERTPDFLGVFIFKFVSVFFIFERFYENGYSTRACLKFNNYSPKWEVAR